MAEAIDGGDINIELNNQIFSQNNEPSNKNIKSPKVPSASTFIEDLQEVNVLDRVPANIEHAQKHAQAKRIGKPVESCKDICECCGIQVENQSMSIFCNNLDLSFLGPGIPLYFGFVKACLMFFVAAGAIYTTYGMILNHKGDYCYVPKDGTTLLPDQCFKNIFNDYSLINRRDNYDSLKHQNWVNLGIVFLLVICLHLYRRQMRQQEEALDFNLVSPSDFTAQLSDLPPKYTQEDIRNLLNEWWNNQTQQTKDQVGAFVIEKICIAYDVKEYMAKMSLRNQINLQLRKNDYFEKKNKQYPPGQSKQDLLSKRKDVQQQIDDLEKLVFDGKYDKMTPQCFVTFNTRKVLECLIDSQQLSSLQQIWIQVKKFLGSDLYDILTLKYNGDNYIISVRRAPEPSDVTWENCGATNLQKFSKRIFTWFCTLIVLGICFILIYLINKWQYNVNKENKDKQDDSIVKAELFLLSLFSSFSIVFINIALTIVLRILSTMELQSTVTQLNISVAEKLTVAQFCNSALITLAVNFTIDPDSFWGNGGITNDFTLIAFSNCVIPPILNFLNPWHLIRIVKRNSIKNDKNGLFSQGEANSWFEGGPLDIAVKYASVIKTLWMIGFYTPLSPYLPCLGIITLIFSYWMDKYLLLNRMARPNLLGSDLNKEMIELAEYFPFSIAIGNLVWMRKLAVNDKDSVILQLVAIGIGAINFIIPSGKINKMIFKIKELDDSSSLGTYQQNKYNFNVEYDRCNPITKEEAIKSYFKELQTIDKNKANSYLNKVQVNQNVGKNFLKQIASQPTSIITSAVQGLHFGNQQYNQPPQQQDPQQYSAIPQMPPVQFAQPQIQPIVQTAYVANPLLDGQENKNQFNQPAYNVVGAYPPQIPGGSYPPQAQGGTYPPQIPGGYPPQAPSYQPYDQNGQYQQGYPPQPYQQPPQNPGQYIGMSQYKYPNQLPYSNNIFGSVYENQAPQQQQQQPQYGFYDKSNHGPHQNHYA